ncbi:MAG: aldehyde ferredoxin oxidoreductase [Methanocalculus sp. MSAO_Arc1]|nr:MULTISPECIES: aldehyde ferredoxin oxidoreductase family protein [unclassified Methanocalculus]RQD80853.1 MAG: aldehyde ferredoxin oxidoreductase [Methanocalculus sp. MSAO_Arc1]
MDGYAGKIPYVDLTRGTIDIQETPADLKRDYLGGRGFGTKIISDRMDPLVDPLSPENVFVLASGPTTGTGIPLGSRYEVSTKSPLNNTLMSANSGGTFGWKIKKAGFDAVVFEGRSEKPVYLYLNEGAAELRDASSYWGMDVHETTDALLADLDDTKAKVACIGPAGETKSLLACVMNDRDRAAGRGGAGAVLGSKNLKAIVATGNLRIDEGDKDRLNAVKERIRTKLQENGICEALTTYGTAVLVNIINENYILPTKNFQTAYFEKAENISGERMAETILKKNSGCYACIVKCSRVCEVDGVVNEGPEYEPIWAFGANLGIDDLNVITRAAWECNKLGLDAIGTPTTIACAMEMREKGYINEGPTFGESAGIVDLVRQIGRREGFGAELTDGSYRFAERHGHPELSMSVKKQDLPAYDPRGLQGHGLSYATSNRGGDHVYGYLVAPEVLGAPEKLDPYVNEGKAAWVQIFQDLSAAIDASGMCLFSSFALDATDYADLTAATMGTDLDAAGFLKIGERIWNLQKLFNIKVGYTKADDTLPKRLLSEPLQEGGPKGRVWEPEPLLSEYYSIRGWDAEGVPTEEKLRELGLL